MATYKKTRTLTSTDAAYIAGLIDGEGTISLSRRHKNENRQLEISISNTETELLTFVLQSVGAGRITKKKTYNNKHTPSATYIISNRQALDLLKQIQPYLRTYKKVRAEIVLEHYLRLTPRNGKYTQKLQQERETFVKTFLNTKAVM